MPVDIDLRDWVGEVGVKEAKVTLGISGDRLLLAIYGEAPLPERASYAFRRSTGAALPVFPGRDVLDNIAVERRQVEIEVERNLVREWMLRTETMNVAAAAIKWNMQPQSWYNMMSSHRVPRWVVGVLHRDLPSMRERDDELALMPNGSQNATQAEAQAVARNAICECSSESTDDEVRMVAQLLAHPKLSLVSEFYARNLAGRTRMPLETIRREMWEWKRAEQAKERKRAEEERVAAEPAKGTLRARLSWALEKWTGDEITPLQIAADLGIRVESAADLRLAMRECGWIGVAGKFRRPALMAPPVVSNQAAE